jgi:NTP pyrophosphatase (non-canonical NTP hydrolase)
MKDYTQLVAKLRATKSESKRKLLDDAAMAIECMQKELDSVGSHRVYREALETYGEEAQTLMMFEEMSELQKELCKHSRGRKNKLDIAEEIADVQIMLAQMIILHDCANAVEEFKRAKIKRLEDNLRNGN